MLFARQQAPRLRHQLPALRTRSVPVRDGGRRQKGSKVEGVVRYCLLLGLISGGRSRKLLPDDFINVIQISLVQVLLLFDCHSTGQSFLLVTNRGSVFGSSLARGSLLLDDRGVGAWAQPLTLVDGRRARPGRAGAEVLTVHDMLELLVTPTTKLLVGG